MVHLYVEAYTAIWAVVTLATYLLGRRFSDDEQPDHQVLTSVLAGAMWPVVVVGLLEAFTVALMSGSHAWRDPARSRPASPPSRRCRKTQATPRRWDADAPMVAWSSPIMVCSRAFCSRSPRSAARSEPPGSTSAAMLRTPLTGMRSTGYHGGM